ncbi:MAG: DUF1592 domain-containing protein [Myxococcota bacterium]
MSAVGVFGQLHAPPGARAVRRRASLVGLALFVGSGCYSGLSEGGDGVPPRAPGAAGDDDGDDGSDAADDDGPSVGECDADTLGRTTLRRLNRREYLHTTRDLLGLPQTPELALPWDSLNALGLDNDGDALSMDLTAAEQYYEAATSLAELALEEGEPPLGQCAQEVGAQLTMCVDAGLGDWLELAFRAPVDTPNVERLRTLLLGAGSYAEVVDTVVTFTLTSPHFLFHHSAPADLAPGDRDDYVVADRLAYLLWSSMPDATLLEAAAAGTLGDPDQLETQLSRMLDDPRAERFYAEFTSLWLKLSLLNEKPGATEDEALFADMQRETTARFGMMATDGSPLRSLLTADESYVSGRLATHYGMATTLADDEWAVVTLPPAERRGLLTQSSVLAVSAGVEFSDPIRRGAWVSEQINCVRPPPPPFEPPELPEPDEVGAETVRDVLEQHVSDPTCAACHKLMDPYGLAMEHYDRNGAYRATYESGAEIDASGTLLSGAEFEDVLELGQVMADEGGFETCLATYVASYGLGRALSPDEMCFLELATAQAREDREDFGMRELLGSLVTSYLFVTAGGPQ